MSQAKALTAEHLMDLLPMTKFMTVRMSRHPDIINIDTDMQTGLILDMGLEGTRPSGVTTSGSHNEREHDTESCAQLGYPVSVLVRLVGDTENPGTLNGVREQLERMVSGNARNTAHIVNTRKEVVAV